MDQLFFKVAHLSIKAKKTEVKNQNIPSKFLKAFQNQVAELKENFDIYNLTINGNGRFYFIPGLNFIAIYILGEFHPFPELAPYISDINKAFTQSSEVKQ